jgi:hypothetical protein
MSIVCVKKHPRDNKLLEQAALSEATRNVGNLKKHPRDNKLLEQAALSEAASSASNLTRVRQCGAMINWVVRSS